MVAFVRQDEFAFADHDADDAEVDPETGAVKQGGFLVHQAGQRLLQFQVNVQGSVQKTRSGAACAAFCPRPLWRLP